MWVKVRFQFLKKVELSHCDISFSVEEQDVADKFGYLSVSSLKRVDGKLKFRGGPFKEGKLEML